MDLTIKSLALTINYSNYEPIREMKFSQRIGVTPVDTVLQRDGMTPELRNSLWNVLDIHMWSAHGFLYSQGSRPVMKTFSRNLWQNFLKEPLDRCPTDPDLALSLIREMYFNWQWHEVYDFIEFIVTWAKVEKLSEALNKTLELELAGYTILENMLVPITTKEELDAVKQAIGAVPFGGVTAHLKQALAHLADRKQPDYRNSIKESISAVESCSRTITGNDKATLGEALTAMERAGRLHTSLKRAFSALYGYTSDEGGIRHAMQEEPGLTAADAKFFLVTCSSFINYMIAKSAEPPHDGNSQKSQR